MFTIGDRTRIPNDLRDEFFSLSEMQLFEAMDAPEWVPMGGVYATTGVIDGCCNYHVPRGFDSWVPPSARFGGYYASSSDKPALARGGVRARAGRKPLDPDGTIVITARVTAKQKAAYDMVGGVSWLRGQLDLFTGD